MKTEAQEYATWIVENQDKQGTEDFETVARVYESLMEKKETGFQSAVVEPQKEPELSDLASYGFQEQLSDVEMVTKRFLAESTNPFNRYIYGSRFMGIGAGDSEFDIGKGFESATELYGSDFVWGVHPSGKKGGPLPDNFVWNDSLTPDDRLAIMDDVSAKSLEQNHPEVSKYLKEAELTTKQEIALGVGKAGGAIASPTTFVPSIAIAKTTGCCYRDKSSSSKNQKDPNAFRCNSIKRQ